MTEPRLVVRLRRLGRVLALVSVGLGAMFVVLARRSGEAGEAGDFARWLFAGAAVLQFALALMLLRRGRGR